MFVPCFVCVYGGVVKRFSESAKGFGVCGDCL